MSFVTNCHVIIYLLQPIELLDLTTNVNLNVVILK